MGTKKALKKDPSSEGSSIKNHSRSKCGTPTPEESFGILSGQVSVRTIRENRPFGTYYQRSNLSGLSEWPPSGAPSLGPIPGTESPRNRVKDPNMGLFGLVCHLFGSWFAGKTARDLSRGLQMCKGLG